MAEEKLLHNSYKMESGVLVSKVTSNELAELLLNNPGTVYGFTTSLHDIHENPCKTVSPWPYYNVMCVQMIDTQIVYINRSCMFGGNPYVFDVPSYDCNYKVHDEECLLEIVDGLIEFNLRYGEYPNTWYMTENIGKLEVKYSEL